MITKGLLCFSCFSQGGRGVFSLLQSATLSLVATNTCTLDLLNLALNCFFSFSEHLSATEIGCNFVNQKCIRSYQISTKAMHITAKSNLFKLTLTASLFCIRACICIASQSDHVSRCASNCLWGIDRHSYQIHLDLTVLGIKKVFSLHLFRLISLKTWSINAPFYEYAQVPWQMWSL